MKCIRTRYVGPTDYRGSRIIADDGDGNRITFHYRHELSTNGNHKGAAAALMQKMGWDGQLVTGWHGHSAYHVFTERGR